MEGMRRIIDSTQGLNASERKMKQYNSRKSEKLIKSDLGNQRSQKWNEQNL